MGICLQWSTLSLHTGPTYTLSLKSNGCIIFVAPISPSKLIVTSKHALGPMQGVSETHSEVGHRWLKKHLEEKGKTEEQLASKLWEKNWTTIAEVYNPYNANKGYRVNAYPTALRRQLRGARTPLSCREVGSTPPRNKRDFAGISYHAYRNGRRIRRRMGIH